MKIRKGDWSYTIKEPIGQLLSVTLDDGAMLLHLQIVSGTIMAQFKGENPELRATPAQCALVGKKLLLFPTPDQAARLIVRYYPEVREL